MNEQINNADKQITKVDLNQLKSAITNIKFALNKATKAGVYELDEAKTLAINVDLLAEHYLMLEKVAQNIQNIKN